MNCSQLKLFELYIVRFLTADWHTDIISKQETVAPSPTPHSQRLRYNQQSESSLVSPALCRLSEAPHCSEDPEDWWQEEKKPSLGGAARSFAAVQVYMCCEDYILPSNINQNSSAHWSLIVLRVISRGHIYTFAFLW